MKIQIEGLHDEITPAQRALIEERLSKLTKYNIDLIHIRITLEKDLHHQKGNDCARIVLLVPGNTLVANKTDDTLENALFKAFDAIERELKDYIKERQVHAIKPPATQPRGAVSQIFKDKGYGFILTEEGREVYFHKNSVRGVSFENLEVGIPVEFDLEEGRNGPQATRVAVF